MKTQDFKSFNYLENGEVYFSNLDTVKTVNKLDSASYKLTYLPYPEDRIQLKMDTDSETVKIHIFPDKDRIDNLVNSFFDETVVLTVQKLGFYHKCGVLFYGKEGTGKSTIMKHYYDRLIIERQAIVFHIVCIPDVFERCWDFIIRIRTIQKNPIVIVLEEVDRYTERISGFLKTILDGNMSINNCIFFASTNYIDSIPEAIKNRPSRFKYSLNIEGIHSKSDIFNIIKPMLLDVCPDSELPKYSSELVGSTLDEIKQFCLDKIMNIKSHKPTTRSIIGFIKDKI